MIKRYSSFNFTDRTLARLDVCSTQPYTPTFTFFHVCRDNDLTNNSHENISRFSLTNINAMFRKHSAGKSNSDSAEKRTFSTKKKKRNIMQI